MSDLFCEWLIHDSDGTLDYDNSAVVRIRRKL